MRTPACALSHAPSHTHSLTRTLSNARARACRRMYANTRQHSPKLESQKRKISCCTQDGSNACFQSRALRHACAFEIMRKLNELTRTGRQASVLCRNALFSRGSFTTQAFVRIPSSTARLPSGAATICCELFRRYACETVSVRLWVAPAGCPAVNCIISLL
eukprot:6207470-Pleurochrysis_carterae.AAC.2